MPECRALAQPQPGGALLAVADGCRFEVRLPTPAGCVEIAASADHRERVLGAFAAPTGRHATGNRTPTPQPGLETDRTT